MDEIPTDLGFFSGTFNMSRIVVNQSVELWKTKSYHLFASTLGVAFEQILYEQIFHSHVQLSKDLGLEVELDSYKFMYKNQRGNQDTFGQAVNSFKSFKQKYKRRSLSQNVSPNLSFKILMQELLDDDVKKLLIQNLEKILIFRNSYTHGNLQEFARKLYPNVYIPNMTSFKVEFKPFKFDPSKTRTFDIRLCEAENTLILMHFYGHGIIDYLKKDMINLFVQTGYILDYLNKESSVDSFQYKSIK